MAVSLRVKIGVEAGADYEIVGRTIYNSENPEKEAQKARDQIIKTSIKVGYPLSASSSLSNGAFNNVPISRSLCFNSLLH